jgi:hypothetical protein
LTRIPYNGCFELEPLLRAKMALVESVVSDWAMNICPDEILHANRAGTSLAAEVARLEEEGFNAVNFDEFVFLPVAEPWVDGLRDWPAPRSYYFFAPSPLRQMRLWKKELGFSMVRHAGHRLEGDHLRPAPDSLVLRHYIFRNQEHAYEKYATRPFSPQELARGWHRNRYGIPATSYRFPAPETLEWLESPQSCTFNRSAPRLKHYWDS